MKKFKVKEAEPIALVFGDGREIQLCFSMKALMYMGEEINERKIKLTGPDFFSAIIYSGAKACNPDFTREEANALFVRLSESYPDALTGIIDEYCEASGIDTSNLKKNLIFKMV